MGVPIPKSENYLTDQERPRLVSTGIMKTNLISGIMFQHSKTIVPS